MKVVCPGCGEVFKVSIAVNNRGVDMPVCKLGRKPLAIPFVTIKSTLSESKDVTRTAELLGCSRAYLYKVIKANKTTVREILGAAPQS